MGSRRRRGWGVVVALCTSSGLFGCSGPDRSTAVVSVSPATTAEDRSIPSSATSSEVTVATTTTTPATMLPGITSAAATTVPDTVDAAAHRLAGPELPRLVNAILSVDPGAGPSHRSLTFRRGDGQPPDPSRQFGWSEAGIVPASAAATGTIRVGSVGADLQDGGVDDAALDAWLVASGVPHRTVDGIEVYDPHAAEFAAARLLFDVTALAHADGFLAYSTDRDDATDLVASVVLARDRSDDRWGWAPAFAPVAAAAQLHGTDVSINLGNLVLRANPRYSDEQAAAAVLASGYGDVPKGAALAVVGTGTAGTVTVTRLATPDDATAALAAYHAIWTTRSALARTTTWADRYGAIDLRADGPLVIGTLATAQRELLEAWSPVSWLTI